MANRKQLNILTKQSVDAWNQWRENHPDEEIDLRGANLKERNLSGVNFRKADIRGTSFKNATLRKADFTQAKAGHTLPETCAQFLLATIHGIVVGWFLCMAGVLYAAIFNAALPSQTITPVFLVALLGVSCVFTGSTILAIRRGKVVEAGARTKAAKEFMAGVVTVIGVVPVVMVAAGAGVVVAAVVGIASVIGVIAAIIVMVWSGIGSIAAVVAMAMSAVIAVTTAVIGTVVVVGFVFKTVAVAIAVAVAVIVNISAISFYIGWRTRYEDPQFSLLRAAGLNLVTQFGTDFLGADLTDAIFNAAHLQYARFVKATLNGVSWRQAQQLQFARFSGTILVDRDVRELLVYSSGRGYSLRGKNLHGAYLVKTDLRNADLRETELIQANLSQADITGAKLYGSARENWIIDKIHCDHVYWDEAGKERTPEEDRPFRPGEFEELYKQLPTFDYVFEHGFTSVDTVIMGHVTQAINERHPEFNLDLVNFDKRGEPHATFVVSHQDDVKDAKAKVAATYEQRIVALEAQKDQLMNVIKMLGSGGVMLQPVAGGMNIRHTLSPPLTQQIVEFLGTLPGLEMEDARRAWIFSAGLDLSLQQQIQIGGSSAQFLQLLVHTTVTYGRLNDGRLAIETILAAAKSKVGRDRQADGNALIQQIHTEVNDWQDIKAS